MKYDVVIVGAGLAGLKAAEVLAKGRKKVIVLEKDSDFCIKPCAAGVLRYDLRLIPESIIERKFRKIYLNHKNKKYEFKGTKKPLIITVDKKRLCSIIAESALKNSAEIVKNSQVSKITNDFAIANNKKYFYKYLIGADGSNSIIRRHLGLKTKKLHFTLEYSTKKKFNELVAYTNFENGLGYHWIFPHKGYASIGSGSTNPKNLKEHFYDFCRKINVKADSSKLKGAIINFDYQGYRFGNKFLIGDAAGFASGFTGQGIYFALKSAEDAAKLILDKNYEPKGIEEILRMKKRQETLMELLETGKKINKKLFEFEFSTLLWATQKRAIVRWLARLFSWI